MLYFAKCRVISVDPLSSLISQKPMLSAVNTGLVILTYYVAEIIKSCYIGFYSVNNCSFEQPKEVR